MIRRTTLKLLFLFTLCCPPITAQETIESLLSPYSIVGCRYWFDNSTQIIQSENFSGKMALDVSALEEGFHILHYQVIDSKGEASPSRTRPFFRLQPVEERFKDYSIASVRYWFDKDITPKEAAYTGGVSSIDVSALEEGFHILHYQVIDSKGEASPSRTKPFFRLQPEVETFKDYAVQTVEYWFDNDVSTIKSEYYDASTTTIDLSHLPEGPHTLCYQVKTGDGQVSPARSVNIERQFYDIYISKMEEYGDSLLNNNPIFSTRPDLKLHFLPTDVSVRGHLTVKNDATLSLGNFVQTSNWGNKSDANKYIKTGLEYYHPTTLINQGFMRADTVVVKQELYRDRWHFISLPFNVHVSDIEVPQGTYWALREYDGEARASGLNANTWTNVSRDSLMEAGRGYIIQLTKEGTENSSTLTFKSVNDTKKNDIFKTGDVTTSLQEHQSEFPHNRSWNLIGNPYPSFYDTRYIEQAGNIIVWNGNGYTAYSLTDDNYILMPFEAFFIQKPLNSDAITFREEGRQHTHEVQAIAGAKGSGQYSQQRRILNFTLADDINTDCSRIVINENAQMGYESDKDAPKFMENEPLMPQLFSVEGGVQYAINERPQSDGFVAFSVYAPVSGEYHFGIEGETYSAATVYDTEENKMWNLSDGDYVFTAEAGMHRGKLMVSLTGNATAQTQVSIMDDGEMKIVNKELSLSFVKPMSIKVYSIDGKILYSDMTSLLRLKLDRGLYVVDVNGKATKIVIK